MEKPRPMASSLPTKEELVALYGGATYVANSESIQVLSSSDEEGLHAELEDDVVEVVEKEFYDHGRGCMAKAASNGVVVLLEEPEVAPLS